MTGKSYLTYPQTVRDSDEYGNVAVTVRAYDLAKGVLLGERTDYGQSMYRLSVYSGHVSRGVRWLPTRVTTKWRHPDDTSVWTDSTLYAYDSAGRVISETLHSGTPLALTVSRGYDTHGNVTSTHRQGVNASEPSVLTEYESSGRFPVRKSTSPSSTVLTYSYDARGNLLTETDVTIPSQTLVSGTCHPGMGTDGTEAQLHPTPPERDSLGQDLVRRARKGDLRGDGRGRRPSAEGNKGV